MRVVDHARQLDGLPKDIRETNENAEALAGFKVLGYVMIALEICTLGFGLYHLIEGDFFKSAVALAIEISPVVLHLTGMSFERSLHHNNSDRVRRMSDEC